VVQTLPSLSVSNELTNIFALHFDRKQFKPPPNTIQAPQSTSLTSVKEEKRANPPKKVTQLIDALLSAN
jgi:hypothetical protein